MALVLDGSNGITFPNASTQNTGVANTSAILSLIGPKGLATPYLGAGGVVQVLQSYKVDSFSSSSNSYVDVPGLSVSITPTSASSKIFVFVTIAAGNSVSNLGFNLLRNGTNIAQSISGTGNETLQADYTASYKIITYPIMFLDSPATTSALTYKIQMNAYNATSYINVRTNDNYYGSTSGITVMEIAA